MSRVEGKIARVEGRESRVECEKMFFREVYIKSRLRLIRCLLYIDGKQENSFNETLLYYLTFGLQTAMS